MTLIPTFSYNGKDSKGHEASGTLEAASRAAAVVKLRQEGFWIKDLTEEGAEGRGRKSAAQPRPTRWSFWYGLMPVSAGAMASLFEQLGGLNSAGVGMATVVDDLASRVGNSRLRRLLTDVAPRVRAGEGLAECLASYPQIVPAGVVGMVHAGELTGSLDRVCGYLADDYNGEQRIWWLMLFPKLYFAVVLVLATLIPSFPMIVAEPDIILGLQAWARRLVSHELPFLGVLLLAYLLYRIIWCLPPVLKARDVLAYRLPIWCLLTKRVGLYRFTRSLELCIEAGVDFPTAMDASARAAGNALMVRQLEAAAARLRDGIPLHEALGGIPFVTREDLGMLGSAATGGTFDDTLPRMAGRAQDVRDNTVRGLRIGGMAFIFIVTSVIVVVAAAKGYLLLYKTLFNRAGVGDLF